MRTRTMDTMSAHRITMALRVTLSAALLVASVSVSACTLAARPFGVIEPNIVPSAGQTTSVVITREFMFEEKRVQISVPVDQAVYAGSESSQKSAIFIGGASPGNWVPDYYRAFIDEKHQAAFYQAMATALHEVRQREGLDAARYVELVTSMTQQLEYRTDPGNLAPKFPIETYGDGYGDCDDKALLAAAILTRDGYDVAILVFAPEKHVALGVRAPGLDYKQTGYGYVEMTEPSIVGIPTDKLAGGVSLASQPVVIRIGQGQGTYTAGAQSEYIQGRLREIQSALAEMQKQVSTYKDEMASRRASLESAKRATESASDPASQADAVRRYNAQVDEFNGLVAKSNEVANRSNQLVDAERFFADHQMSRPQVYERLRAAAL